MKVTLNSNVPAKALLLTMASNFYAEILFNGSSHSDINLDIDIVPRVKSNKNFAGYCNAETEGFYPKWFTICIKEQDTYDMLLTLAHEMVHLKQMATNQLSYASEPVAKGLRKNLSVFWEGSFWYPKKKEDYYFDSPWEIEAYGREDSLAKRFSNYFETLGLE